MATPLGSLLATEVVVVAVIAILLLGAVLLPLLNLRARWRIGSAQRRMASALEAANVVHGSRRVVTMDELVALDESDAEASRRRVSAAFDELVKDRR